MTLNQHDLVLCTGTVPKAPFFERLGPARDSGFRALSMQPGEYLSLRAEGVSDTEIRSRLADHGLQISELDAITTWFPGHEPPPAWGSLGETLRANTADGLCPIGEAIGARSVTVVEFYGIEVDVDIAAEGFAAVCDRAAQHGLLAHIEFLPWAGVPTLSRAWEIVQRADRPNGGLLVDSWHLFRGGSTLAELAVIPGDRVMYVQIDDAPAEAERDLSEETQHRRLLPGAGSFDLVGLIRTLDQIGSTAPIGVEVFSDELAERPVEEIAFRCAESVLSVLKAARAG